MYTLYHLRKFKFAYVSVQNLDQQVDLVGFWVLSSEIVDSACYNGSNAKLWFGGITKQLLIFIIERR